MKKSTTAKLAAFVTAMLWGSTFAIGKIAAESFSASFIIALRFSVASVVLLIAAYPLRKMLNKEYWTAGICVWCSVCDYLVSRTGYIKNVNWICGDFCGTHVVAKRGLRRIRLN